MGWTEADAPYLITQDVSDIVQGGTLVSGGLYHRPVAPAPHTRSCAYCGRASNSTVGNCEGCGAPVGLPYKRSRV